jgi:hypothetical protein
MLAGLDVCHCKVLGAIIIDNSLDVPLRCNGKDGLYLKYLALKAPHNTAAIIRNRI